MGQPRPRWYYCLSRSLGETDVGEALVARMDRTLGRMREKYMLVAVTRSHWKDSRPSCRGGNIPGEDARILEMIDSLMLLPSCRQDEQMENKIVRPQNSEGFRWTWVAWHLSRVVRMRVERR